MSHVVWIKLIGLNFTNYLLKLPEIQISNLSFESQNLRLNALHIVIKAQQWIQNKSKQTISGQPSTDLGKQLFSFSVFPPSGSPSSVWKLWNLFDELTIRHRIVCREHENLKNIPVIFQKGVPPT